MGQVWYLALDRLNLSSSVDKCVEKALGSDPEPDTDLSHRYGISSILATCLEYLLATSASFITSSYTLRHELPDVSHYGHVNSDETLRLTPGYSDWILDPSPTLMLASCLVLGCTVSSFIYRHKETDVYQAPIFIGAITFAGLVGLWMGIAVNLVMLSLIPWAFCLAMMFSKVTHWLVRRYTATLNYGLLEVEEKGQATVDFGG